MKRKALKRITSNDRQNLAEDEYLSEEARLVDLMKAGVAEAFAESEKNSSIITYR